MLIYKPASVPSWMISAQGKRGRAAEAEMSPQLEAEVRAALQARGERVPRSGLHPALIDPQVAADLLGRRVERVRTPEGRYEYRNNPSGRIRLDIRRVYLDRGGYDRNGRYFGVGMPLFLVTPNDSEVGPTDVYVRGASAVAVRAGVNALVEQYWKRYYEPGIFTSIEEVWEEVRRHLGWHGLGK